MNTMSFKYKFLFAVIFVSSLLFSQKEVYAQEATPGSPFFRFVWSLGNLEASYKNINQDLNSNQNLILETFASNLSFKVGVFFNPYGSVYLGYNSLQFT